MNNSGKKKKKLKGTRPTAYQAVVIENYDDGTFLVRMESGRLEGDSYVPEQRQSNGARCDAETAAGLVGDAAGRFQRALRETTNKSPVTD